MSPHRLFAPIKILVIVGLLSIPMAPVTAQASSNLKTIATDLLLKGIAQGDKKFIMENVLENYIQHNPVAPDGRAGLLGFIDFLKAQNRSIAIEPIRVLRDGDLVAIHSQYDNGKTKRVIFDLFRFEDGKVAEHWDGIQELGGKNPSGRTMLDGATQITGIGKTEENRNLVTNFIKDVLFTGDGSNIDSYIGDIYLQHNPRVGDGADGLRSMFAFLKTNKISFGYTKIHKVVAEGNFVLTLSEGKIGGKTNAFYDLFRVDGGKIVEHWDVVQEVPEKMPHNNGMF